MDAQAPNYDWWEKALQGHPGPIHDGHPQPGFYRRRVRDQGTWEGIAIWLQDGVMVAVMGIEVDRATGERHPKKCDPNEAWSWGSKNPVAFANYERWKETGLFSDDIPAPPPPARGSVPGDNLGDGGTLFDQLRREAIDLGDQLVHFIDLPTNKSKVSTQEEADRAAALAKAAMALAKKADGEREEEKRPFLEGGRAVDAKWNPLIDLASNAGKSAKLAIAPFLNGQRLAEEARQKAARQAAADAAAAATALSTSADAADQERAAALEAQVAEHTVDARPRKVSAGRTGAKVVMRTTLVAVIEDYDLALAHFADAPEVRETVQRLAQQAVTAKVTVPGVKAIPQETPA